MVLAVIKIADYKGADGDMKGNSKKGGYIMLGESTKQDLQEMTDMLKSLDSISMMIIKTSASALLARQELAENRIRQQVELAGKRGD